MNAKTSSFMILNVISCTKLYNHMNQDYLESAMDNLQSFMELKMQNLLIYSWIRIKKHANVSSFALHTRNRSYSQSLKYKEKYPQARFGNLITQRTIQPPQLFTQDSNPIKTERPSKQFEAVNRNDQLFQAVNQFRAANGLQSPEHETYQQESSHNVNFQTNYWQDQEDNDQFEDIVLDRLSKLQEHIQTLMAEKRINQEKRGFVGSLMKNNQRGCDEEMEEESSGKSKVSEAEEKRKQPYECWQANPIRSNKADLINSFKHITINRKESANIVKIRELINSTYRQGQNRCLANFPGQDTAVNKPTIPKTIGQNLNTKEVRVCQNEEQVADPSREKGSSTLYLNRYEGNNIKKNGSQVHFIPKNIEMQTVIESRTKFNRNNNPKNMQIRNRQQYIKKQKRLILNGNVSGVSNSSSNSYFSARQAAVNNRSALY